MKKIIFGIFAHPDDEAFGPSGALLLESKAGNQVHLITLTDGAAGSNPDNHQDLGKIRLDEWYAAGALIGAQSMHYLGHTDGKLDNQTMLIAHEQIEAIVRAAITDTPDDVTIEFITNDLNGITGHVDHIVAARAACFVFDSMKQTDARFSRMRLACVPRTALATSNTRWLFMEIGRGDDEIDEVVDARSAQSEIKAIMRTHHTQRADGEMHISQLGDQLGINYFIVRQ